MRPNAMSPYGKAKRSVLIPSRPSPARPSFGRPRAYPGVIPYPVYERTITEPEPRAGNAASLGPTADADLTWLEPEPLADVRRPAKAGLFAIERADGNDWTLLQVGMSSTDVGDALRWIVRAPAMLGLEVDWATLRVRIAEAGFDTSTPAGRATLRRLRDETEATRGVATSNGPDRAPTASVNYSVSPRPAAQATYPAAQQGRRQSKFGVSGSQVPFHTKVSSRKRSFASKS